MLKSTTRRTFITTTALALVVIASSFVGPGPWIKSSYAQDLRVGDETWDQLLTSLIRRDGERDRIWSNWSFNPHIELGAVGYLNGQNGKFKYHTTLPDISAKMKKEKKGGIRWDFKSEGVNKRSGWLDASVSAKVPVPGTPASVGGGGAVAVSWDFSKARSIASSFTIEKQQWLDDVREYIKSREPELKKIAAANRNVHDDKIDQGFGVVTSVIWASSGLNLASRSKKSAFSISGSQEVVAAMTGVGEVSRKIAGGYKSTDERGDVVKSIWPAKPEETPTGPVPIAFEFASFAPDGEIMTGWVGYVDSFLITIDHTKRGGWLTHAELSYRQPDSDKAEVVDKLQNLSAGRYHNFVVPMNAYKLKLKVWFEASEKVKEFNWQNPLDEIPKGQVFIDIHGLDHLHLDAIERDWR